ncbi:sulfatase family protein [Fulvitalea axinellae]
MSKHYLTGLSALALTAGTLSSCTEKTQTERPPNIVWLIAEDLSQDLGCYGNSNVQTPTIDSLALNGKRFTNMYATAAVCSPSRTALATGFYQNSIGAYHMRYPDSLKPALPEKVLPIHRLLAENNYQTANIKSRPSTGKTDWLFKFDPKTYDFEKWDDIDKEKPFFARVNFSLTHRGFSRDSKRPVDPSKVNIPPYYPDHSVSRRDWANYLESAQILDNQVRQVIKQLNDKGLMENTLVFFFSDHGRPMTRGKCFLYDSGLKVPFIAFASDSKIKQRYLKGKTDDRMWSMLDINATTLALAGVKGYASQGRTFIGENAEGRDFVYAASDRIGEVFFKSRTVRTKKLRYIRNLRNDLSVNEASTAYRKANHPIYHLIKALDEKGTLTPAQKQLVTPIPPEELYDLESDPYETVNLANDPAWKGKLAEMRKLLDSTTEEIGDLALGKDPQEIKDAFKQYGIGSEKRNRERIRKLEASVKAKL